MARKAQAWSLDLIIGVLIFMVAAGIVISLLTDRDNQDPAPLRVESEVVATKLVTQEDLQIAPGNQLNMAALYALAANATKDYDATRGKLGVQNEFCIYLQDEEGNLIFIKDPSDLDESDGINTYAGVGSATGEVNLTSQEIPCGKKCYMDDDGSCNWIA